MIDFLEEMVCNTNLLPAEHKTAASILRTISKEASEPAKPDLTKLLQPPEVGILNETKYLNIFFYLKKVKTIWVYVKNTNLLPAEHKTAASILRTISK